MKTTKGMTSLIGLIVLITWVGMAEGGNTGTAEFFVDAPDPEKRALAFTVTNCTGPVRYTLDAADETVRTTPAIFGNGAGGGEGGQFDPTPVLSIDNVSLEDGECLNAHLSAIVGSAQTYGVAPLALFQVTLTPAGGSPRHMVGHYETPYAIPSPAVALEAERDVDMLAANFFQRAGFGTHEVPPGTYTVDVWWAGAPTTVPGGAIGAAFVLKLNKRSIPCGLCVLSNGIFCDGFECGDTSGWSGTTP